MEKVLIKIVDLSRGVGKVALRGGLVVVFAWIGFLKFYDYEAEGIVPFVANSPFMSFFYAEPHAYAMYVDREGEHTKANHDWHMRNNTYAFSRGLGVFLIIVAAMVSMHYVFPLLGLVGGVLMMIMTFGTLSFLVTTPECWVPDLGGSHGFPLLSARGRLVVKDIMILAGSIIAVGESAQLYLKRIANN